MPRVRIANRDLVPLAESLTALGQWLKPGILALRFAQIKNAVQPSATEVFKQREALMDEFAVKGEDGKRKSTQIKQGDRVVGMRVELTDAEAYSTRERELMEAVTEVDVPLVLKEAHIEQMQANMVKDTDALPPVDLAALLCVMDGTADLVS